MAVRDDDKVMDGLLRRTLASSPKPGVPPGTGDASGSRGDDCPPADILAAYYEHSLDADESASYELHFSQCAPCREQLAAMARAEEVPQPRGSWSWLWNPYWLAPALAVLTLAIFFGVHHTSPPTATAITSAPANAPLVAMARPDQAPPQESAAPAPPPPAAARNAPSNEEQKAPSDSVERDSLTERKQSQLRETPAPDSAPLGYSAPSALPESPKPSDKKVQDVPLNGRNNTELQPLLKSETAQKDTGAPQNATQSAAVTSAAQAVQKEQNAEVARQEPAPSPSATAGALGGVAGTRAKTTDETAGKSQTPSFGAMSRLGAAAKSPAPQVAAEISAKKVFQTPNTDVLWRSADGGFVERSPDGGATWEGQPLPGFSGEIAAGSSPTPKICWLVGSAGTIYMTKDATNWIKIVAPASVDFTAVAAKDASNATVTADDGRHFQTTDAGKHWKPIP